MLDEVDVHCPYCGAPLTLLVDGSSGAQQYVEDCHVYCRPMVVRVEDTDPPRVSVWHEDES